MISFLKNRKFDFFPLGVSATIFYFVIFYLVPIFSLVGVSIKFLPAIDVDNKALWYSILGIFCFIFGYLNPIAPYLVKKISNPFKKEWDYKKGFWVFGFIFILGWAVKLTKILMGGYDYLNPSQRFLQNPFYSLFGNLNWLSYIALAIAFIFYFNLRQKGDKLYKIWGVLAWGAFLLELLYSLPSCSRMSMFTPFIIYLIVRWYVWERNLKITLIAAGLMAFILFPLGNACRTPAILSLYQINKPQIGEQQKIPLNKPQIGEQQKISFIVNSAKFASDSFLSRVNELSVFSAIINNSQSLEYGSSLREVLLTFSPPRFLWENKPKSANISSNEFGHKIGVLTPDDKTTGVGPTVIGDWYMNFGLFGIAVGMFLTGIIFKIIYNYFIVKTEASSSGVLIYSFVWIQLIKGMEDWIAPIYVGLFRLLAMLLIIHLFLKKK